MDVILYFNVSDVRFVVDGNILGVMSHPGVYTCERMKCDHKFMERKPDPIISVELVYFIAWIRVHELCISLLWSFI